MVSITGKAKKSEDCGRMASEMIPLSRCNKDQISFFFELYDVFHYVCVHTLTPSSHHFLIRIYEMI